MSLRTLSVTLPALAFLVMTGCEGGQVAGPGGSIDTIVEPSETRAGQPVTVRCEVRNDRGEVVEWAAQVTIEPAAGVTMDGTTATATVAGSVSFACHADDVRVSDDSPATLLVTPADPASTVVTLDPSTVPAGTPSVATCGVFDAYGNAIADAKTTIDPLDGLTIDDANVSAAKVGTYNVGCSATGFEVTKTTAPLTVTPADPKRLVVTGDPDREVYSVGQTVLVGWRVYDAFENEIKGLPATVTPPADPGMSPQGNNRFKFIAEGHYRVHVALDAPWETVENSRMFVCDDGPPTIEDLFPPRGYTQAGDPALIVSGRLNDAAGSLGTVTVNGEPATMAPDGSFTYPTTGLHGLNVLVIVADDGYGHQTRTTRGWYYSTGWFKVDDTTTLDNAILPESVLLNLGQNFLDDGDHDPAHPNDLATLVEIVLGSAIQPLLANLPPFSFPLPNVIDVKIAGVGLEGDLEVVVTVKDVTLGKPTVAMDLMDGGVSASLGFQPVSLGLELQFIVHARATGFGQTIPLLDPSTSSSGSLSVGTLGVTVALNIVKPLGGDLSVTGRDFQLVLTDVAISPIETLKIHLGKIPNTAIDLGEVDLTWLVGGINDLLAQYVVNPLINLITQPLIDLLEPLVVNLIGDLFKQVFDLLNIRQTIPLPDLLGTGKSVDLGLGLGISSVLFTEDAGRVGLDLGFATTKGVTREPPLGSILRDACDQTETNPIQFVFPAEPSVQVGLAHDAINELLFMVWWSGMLQGSFDASSLLGGGGALPVENLIIKPTLWLPPIINDCRDNAQRIEIGDVFLDIQMDLLGNSQWLEVWLQLSAEVEITATGDQVGIKIGKIQTMEYELYDVGGGLADLLDMLGGFLPDLLKGIEGQSFEFPIPGIPLDGLLPGIPAGTTLQLGDLAAGVDQGVIRIGGNLK
jgi:hypothetical protein